MSDDAGYAAGLLAAARFAADRHRDQRRKGIGAPPYINHPIEVAETMARVGGVAELRTLQAALLHDVLEDTRTTPAEIEREFGREVRALVEEVTDDKLLPWQRRKALQVENAPALSTAAKQIRIADKICNLVDLVERPPEWDAARKRRYLEWADRVVHGCRGCSEALERHYDEVSRAGRGALG